MINYPDKDFLINFKKQFLKRENMKIKISGFRTIISKKQISRWGRSIIDAENAKNDKNIGGINLSMIFCMKLMSMHFLAISHGYIMNYKIMKKFIEIDYEYCLID